MVTVTSLKSSVSLYGETTLYGETKRRKMKVIGIVSGGLDSCSYIAQYVGHELHLLSFNYGQKATKELQSVERVLYGFAKEFKILDISFMKELWAGSQLTDSDVTVEPSYAPNVIVPLRNMVFATIATAYAVTIGADRVLLGCHLGDTTIFNKDYMYPDCDFRSHLALETALHMAERRGWVGVGIWSPNREGLTKAENLKRGYEKIGNRIYDTWSCYHSEEKHCGVCESCNNRKDAFRIAEIEDLTEYEQG